MGCVANKEKIKKDIPVSLTLPGYYFLDSIESKTYPNNPSTLYKLLFLKRDKLRDKSRDNLKLKIIIYF